MEMVARKWEVANSSIAFDFGSGFHPQDCGEGVYEIRISFEGVGISSEVGLDSINRRPMYSPSMVLGRFDKSPPSEPEYQRWVLHEFGHALGFYHEHQGPMVNCEEELLTDKLYDKLSKPPWNWDRSFFDKNIRQIKFEGPLTEGFDPESIMLYSFQPEYYKSGTASECYHPPNEELSSGDRGFAVRYFPMVGDDDISQIVTERSNMVEDLASMIRGLGLQEESERAAVQQVSSLSLEVGTVERE